MGKFSLRHTINCTEDVFWEKIYKNEDFNEKLYLHHLKFGYTLEEGHPEGLKRRARVVPEMDAPAVVRKALGEGVAFTEVGTFDPEKKIYDFYIEPSTLQNKIKITGKMWIEPVGDDKCKRCVDFDITAKIFGVGKVIEMFVEKNTTESYDDSARFTNEYLKNA